MARSMTDELMLFGAGVLAEKIVRAVSKKYGDPKASLNFPSLKNFGKPSVYVPLATGAAATVYVVDKSKRRMLDDEDYVLAGLGLSGVADGIMDGLLSGMLPQSTPTAVARTAQSGITIVQGPRAAQSVASGYGVATNGSKRGRI